MIYIGEQMYIGAIILSKPCHLDLTDELDGKSWYFLAHARLQEFLGMGVQSDFRMNSHELDDFGG